MQVERDLVIPIGHADMTTEATGPSVPLQHCENARRIITKNFSVGRTSSRKIAIYRGVCVALPGRWSDTRVPALISDTDLPHLAKLQSHWVEHTHRDLMIVAPLNRLR